MQKRRGGGGTGPAVLPMTDEDAKSPKTLSNRRKRGSQSALQDFVGVFKLLLLIIGLGLTVFFVQRLYLKRRRRQRSMHRDAHGDVLATHIHPATDPRKLDEGVQKTLSLGDFQSLHYAFENSQIVALYFAASWCPQSAPVSQKLHETFGDVVLQPPQSNVLAKLPQRKGLAIVYVSSDKSAEQMAAYVKPSWITIPYDSDERNALKLHFDICAKDEVETLGIDRKYEIPTLLIVSGESRQVLTYSGIKDVEERGAQAVDHWMDLDRLTTALEGKLASQ